MTATATAQIAAAQADERAVPRLDPIGTAIVGDTNGRYFEPSATRNILVGISAYANS